MIHDIIQYAVILMLIVSGGIKTLKLNTLRLRVVKLEDIHNPKPKPYDVIAEVVKLHDVGDDTQPDLGVVSGYDLHLANTYAGFDDEDDEPIPYWETPKARETNSNGVPIQRKYSDD